MEHNKNDKKDQAFKEMSMKVRRKNRATKYPPLPPAFRRVTRSQTRALRMLQNNVSTSSSASDIEYPSSEFTSTPISPQIPNTASSDQNPLKPFVDRKSIPASPEDLKPFVNKQNHPASPDDLKPFVDKENHPASPEDLKPFVDKENHPASPEDLKPFVARLPNFRKNNEPITRRHSFGLSKPYSPERLHCIKPTSKSADAAMNRPDWFNVSKQPAKRDLIPAFVATLPKSSTSRPSTPPNPDAEMLRPTPTPDEHVFAVPDLKSYRRAQYFHKLVQQKQAEYRKQLEDQQRKKYSQKHQ